MKHRGLEEKLHKLKKFNYYLMFYLVYIIKFIEGNSM